MPSIFFHRCPVMRPPVLGCLLCGLLLACGGAEPRPVKPLVCPPKAELPQSCLPPVAEKPPPPPTGKESVGALVDGLSSTDKAFEVPLGQGRILTTRAALADKAVIAVGDPSVVDFIPIPGPGNNVRQIRLLGRRLGSTDLSITTPDGAVYTFEVRVVADLTVLRSQLAC